MTKQIITTIEYAYVQTIEFLPNIAFTSNEGGAGYKHRISIAYELKDVDGKLVGLERREHYSNLYEAMQTYEEYSTWRTTNEAGFIAADKLDLAGYTGD